MVAAVCLAQVQACAIRVALLDTDGVPLPGASNLYVSDALTTLTLSPQYDTANEIKEVNACGATAIDYKGNDTFKWTDISLELITPDPYLHALLSSGGSVLTDGEAVGFAYPPLGLVQGNGVSIELWAKRIDSGDLDLDFPYAWWVLPKVKNLKLGDRIFADAAQKSPFTGQGYENVNWFDGPENDWPVASDRCAQWIPTATLPTAHCGFETLSAS